MKTIQKLVSLVILLIVTLVAVSTTVNADTKLNVTMELKSSKTILWHPFMSSMNIFHKIVKELLN